MVRVYLFIIIVITAVNGNAQEPSYVDTLSLIALPPDSIYVERVGSNVVVRWYPAHDSVATGIGSLDFTNWFGSGDPNEISNVTFSGYYMGDVKIDRTLKFEKITATRDTVGYDRTIPIVIETVDQMSRTYRGALDVGSSYTPGDPLPIILWNPEDRTDSIYTGINAHFSEGIIDTAFANTPFFQVDLQDFEGFHVWRGLSEWPSEMVVIVDVSKEDAYIGVNFDSIYFSQYPMRDEQGRKYYEWIDRNAYVGFTYYYTVTTYDRGYFKGFNPHNKWDSYICQDPDFVQNYPQPEDSVRCSDATLAIAVTVDSGTNIAKIYAVPNPYRTGTSAHITPHYHNYQDETIKFFNVPKEANIKIYTVSGELIWDTHHSSPDGRDGVISWDVKNKSGVDVASGVYVYKCENAESGEEMYGRIVVIR